MDCTSDIPSPDLEPSMVRLRAEIVGTTNVPVTTNDSLTDIFFICGDDFYPIQSHRVILRNWSQFFAKVVDSSLSIKGPFPVAPFIVLKEVCGKDLQDIFKFIYNGEVVIERSRIGSLLRTARFLEINQLPDLLEASEELKDDINIYNENLKASIKSAEATNINSDAASKCSEETIINSDAVSKSSGRNSNNSMETNKSSDEGSDVFDTIASSNVNMSPVNEVKSAESVEKNESKPDENKSSDNGENPSNVTSSAINSSSQNSSSSQTGSKSPLLSLEERVKRQTLYFSSIFRLPKSIEPVQSLKPEKSPTKPSKSEQVEEIDLTSEQ